MLMGSSTNHRLPLLGGVELIEGGTGSVSCSAFMEPENLGRCGPAARAESEQPLLQSELTPTGLGFPAA